MKLGMLQLRGAGDCIILVPIAKHWVDQGNEVYWVIDNAFKDSFAYAFPYINFIGLSPISESDVQGNIRSSFWYDEPRKLLDEIEMDLVFNYCYEEIKYANILNDLEYRRLDAPAMRAQNLSLPYFNKFDEFKYAMSDVPFLEKWNLDINRNTEREMDLYNKIITDKTKPYIVMHLQGGNGRFVLNIDDKKAREIAKAEHDTQVIRIEPITDNLFDWTYILEKSQCFIGMDSFFVNYVDQMRMPIPKKYFLRRSNLEFTPVLGTQWDYLPVKLESDKRQTEGIQF